MFERMFFLSKHHLNWSVSVVGISEFVVEDDLFFVVFVCLCVCVFFFPFPKFFQCCCPFRFWVCWGGVCFKVSGLAVKSNRFFMDVRALNFGRGNTQYVVELMN